MIPIVDNAESLVGELAAMVRFAAGMTIVAGVFVTAQVLLRLEEQGRSLLDFLNQDKEALPCFPRDSLVRR